MAIKAVFVLNFPGATLYTGNRKLNGMRNVTEERNDYCEKRVGTY